MAFVDLPTGCVNEYFPRLVPRPSRSRSAFGTAGANANQLGKHWAFDVTLHAMEQADALIWASRLHNNTGDGHRWAIDQGGLISGSEGTPLVAGGSQQGTSLDIDGATVGLVIPEGAFVSVITSSRRYVNQIAEEATVDGFGAATLTFNAPMRVIPSDNDVVEIATPKIEGLVTFDGLNIRRLNHYLTRGATFTIEERG